MWMYPRITKERTVGSFMVKCKPNPITKYVASFQTLQWYFSPSCSKYSSKFSLDSSFQVPKKGSIMMESLQRIDAHNQKPKNHRQHSATTSSFKIHLHHVTLLKWPVGSNKTKESKHQHWLILSTSKLRSRKLTWEVEFRSIIIASGKQSYTPGPPDKYTLWNGNNFP